jgi:hypothetical protein
VRYEFPLPNDGEGYKFTENELVELLDKVYEKGREYERSLVEVELGRVITKSVRSAKDKGIRKVK